jgi:hypothetical protein
LIRAHPKSIMNAIDPDDVYQRAMSAPDTLDALEQLVAGVQLIESLAAMEGWDFFFTSSYAALYPTVKHGLALAGDHASLAVLESYEAWLESNGVSMDPDDIAELLATLDEASVSEAVDPERQFADLGDQRWQLIRDYLATHGRPLAETQ